MGPGVWVATEMQVTRPGHNDYMRGYFAMSMNSRRIGILASACAAVFTVSAIAAPPPGAAGHAQAPSLFSQPSKDRADTLTERAALNQWLLTEAVERGLRKPLVAEFSAAEMAEVDNARGEDPRRVGLTRALASPVGFSNLKMSQLKGRAVDRGNGAITATADGGFVYSSALSSPGAAGLRVHFTHFNLPERTEVYLYTADGQAFGPYTGRGPLGDGEFWSHTVVGDYLVVQMRHVGQASDQDLRSAGFNITGLAHIRPVFLDGLCADNASCVVNAVCDSDADDDKVAALTNSVALMQWISGAFVYNCTGGLINDSDPGNDDNPVPYFLTANHCINKGKDAKSLENYFQYVDTDCSSDGCLSWSELRDSIDTRTLGASIVSTGRNADYTLLRLAQAAPHDSVYLGWDSTPVAFTDGVALFRVSHPQGSPQAYSQHLVDADAETCQSWPRGDRIYSRDIVGATEGGSSGSPVVIDAGNNNLKIVGQLSGACGTNINNVCDANSNSTVDGAFAAYYDQVSQWLDPVPDTCTPTEEPEASCSDGKDNDCDGLTDDADPDCGDPGGGLPTGAHCLSDSECASGSCSKGKPSSRVCN